MPDSMGHDASNQSFEKFEVFNISVDIGSQDMTGTILLDCAADHFIITCTDESSFGVKVDRITGSYFNIMSGTTTIHCPIKNCIYWRVLNNDAFEVSILVIRNGRLLR